jgi:hypothetical protein
MSVTPFTEPSKLPYWTINPATQLPVNTVGSTYGQVPAAEPSDSKKGTGFVEKEYPPRQDLNWLFRTICQWIGWIVQQIGSLPPFQLSYPTNGLEILGTYWVSSSTLDGGNLCTLPYPTGFGLSKSNVFVIGATVDVTGNPSIAQPYYASVSSFMKITYDDTNIYVQLGSGNYTGAFIKVVFWKIA